MCTSRKREVFRRAGKPVPWFSHGGPVELLDCGLASNYCSCFLELGQELVFLQFFSRTSCLLRVCALFHHSLPFFSLLLVHVCRLKHLQERDRIFSPLSVSVGLGQRWCVGPGAAQEVYPAHVWSVNSREGKSGWLWQLWGAQVEWGTAMWCAWFPGSVWSAVVTTPGTWSQPATHCFVWEVLQVPVLT